MRIRIRMYTNRFVDILAECGIQCTVDDPEHFEISDFVLPAAARG